MLAGCASAPAGGPADASVTGDAAAAPPPEATPSEVYRLRQARLAQMADSMAVAEEEAVRLMRLGEQEEFERVEAELGGLLHSEQLAPFYTDSALVKLEEWDTLSVESRLGMYGMVMQGALPSEFEILNETIDGDRATLRVRGYFEEPVMGDPGWTRGEIMLARQDGEWRIVKESWSDDG